MIWSNLRFTSCQIHFQERQVLNFKLHENHPCQTRRQHAPRISLYLLFGTSFLEISHPSSRTILPSRKPITVAGQSCDQDSGGPSAQSRERPGKPPRIRSTYSLFIPLPLPSLPVRHDVAQTPSR